MIEEIKEISKTFFDKLWIELTSLEVNEEITDIFYIKIDTIDSSLLIWTHGVTFEALQGLLRTLFSQKYDRKIRLHLEINDYIHNKDAKLFALIDREILRAKETGRNMKLPYLNGYERKIVHSYVHKLGDSEIRSKSMWEGADRRMYIILTKNWVFKKEEVWERRHTKLEIDIDSNDI